MSSQFESQILVLALLASMPFGNNQDAPQHNGPVSRDSAASTIEMRTDAEGVDFNSYLRDVYISVRKRWVAKMPASLVKGQQGKNIVEFRVLQDGSVPKEFLKIALSSEKSDFDAASLQGVSDAAPFSHLPESFLKPYIVLRFTFYYNLPIPQNPR
jgi:TonB family protein